ncbi:NarK family nitrate/nitrite MFS transporter [Vibrio sp. MEBiC08052]|uniref:NarK family nitrate/nitrite MFS transporter n=1 Tax=Vibrio sp. MEBiC08052 TaxID=1761910 RepID=UPI0007405969|nr:NarK family nitrate/nitrite MFS transporter [Vibrio sp. MEBiC08052]KUI99644.1 nitrite extrusion protein 1 [Vibrio sp. MEBiC08052]
MSHANSNACDVKSKMLTQWHPEDPQFWAESGKTIANRNLWISIPCLLLSFCVWMLFSAVAVNLNQVGFHFSTDQLFLLTALPAVSGAIGRIPYAFIVPVVGGRKWTVFSTLILTIPCLWLAYAVEHPDTPFEQFVMIALLCGIAGANFASSMANISFFYPKEQQGKALGLNGGLGNLGVSVMQLVVPLVVSAGVFGGLSSGVIQPSGKVLYLANAALVWVPLLCILSVAAWFGMNDLKSAQTSIKAQLPVLKEPHLWGLSILYLATFGSFIGFSAGFSMLSKTQFPAHDILSYMFFGPLVGALARPLGGALSDRLGGIRVTLVNFVVMALLTGAVFVTLPSASSQGSFYLFFATFMGLFAASGLGSGSTFQMIAVIFRKISLGKAAKQGMTPEISLRKASTDTAAALGFISAIGAIGGFFIPRGFGLSLSLTGSPLTAMKVFLVFYVCCVFITWFVYGRNLDRLATKKAAAKV